MVSEWTTCTAGEIAAPTRNALVGGPFGSNLVSADYVESEFQSYEAKTWDLAGSLAILLLSQKKKHCHSSPILRAQAT